MKPRSSADALRKAELFRFENAPESSGASLVSALPVRNALRAGGRGRDIGAAAIDLRRQAPMGA